MENCKEATEEILVKFCDYLLSEFCIALDEETKDMARQYIVLKLEQNQET